MQKTRTSHKGLPALLLSGVLLLSACATPPQHSAKIAAGSTGTAPLPSVMRYPAPRPLAPAEATPASPPPVPAAPTAAQEALAPEEAAPLPVEEAAEPVVMSFTGLASWYGKRFHGRRTASGERYDMAAFTAAHPSLPFGSRVRVTNLKNGRSVVVTINDRGPFVKTRLIDVSRAAAKELGMIDHGVAEVRVDVLESAEG